MISKIQYIGAASAQHTQLENIQAALIAGANWIQLRLKNKTTDEVRRTALSVREMCRQHNAQFLLNDFVDIAKEVQADGVHLGQNDMSTTHARQLLGENAIIGGTANTWEQIVAYAAAEAVDYIGLGPFRFTKTKEKLSPVLGLKGYREIVQQCRVHDIQLPIIAIGGIQLTDIESIMTTGVHGIAVSGLITYAENKAKILTAIHQQMGDH
ncbi:MAG: thiamine phosphate synthase [Bacteroidota bacterium]